MFHSMKKLISDYFIKGSSDLYESMKPAHTFSKMLGYAPYTQKRSSKRLTKSGICYTFSLITIKCLLICVSFNPSQFTKATNSDILNYGIWIQTEVSLVISIWFLLRGLTKISNKWTTFEKFVEIDEVLEKEFSFNLCYRDMKLCAITSSIFGAIAALLLSVLTIYFLIDLPFHPFHKACVCFSIYMSNNCIYAITSEFLWYVTFILVRFHAINNILKQLLLDDSYLKHTIIDESTSKELIYTNYIPTESRTKYKQTFGNKKLKISSERMSEWMDRRKNEYKPPIKLRFKSPWNLFTKIFISKPTFYKSSQPSFVLDKITILISVHEKLTECVTLINNLFSLEVFFILLLIFTYVLFGLFSRYKLFVDYQVEAHSISSLNLTWMQAYTLSTLCLITMSSILTKRAKQTAIIVHRVIRKTKDSEIQNKLFRFSKMLYSRHVTLHFGYTAFNWPFIFQLNGAVASYLIILIQFQLTNRKNNPSPVV